MSTWLPLITATLDHTVDTEIEGLPAGLQPRLIRLMGMVESVGLEQLHEPHVKHLEGKLWELRAKAMKESACQSNHDFMSKVDGRCAPSFNASSATMTISPSPQMSYSISMSILFR
ncbi:type II toxin-antitoxin system RelE/ParE family toxin [Ochrobactrum quorumnocens]|uniref:type II toxin-antitoxin system RelE/ParE family toxin n=1 Tax=Ochrobactrum quorumnocens TaxID=271865 RepID=UPI003144E153